MTTLLLCRCALGYMLTIVCGLGVPGVWISLAVEWLLRALVLDEEQLAAYGGRVEHLPEEERTALTRENYNRDLEARRGMAASDVQLDSRGLTARITLEEEKLVFFAVPWDEGFSAVVNGQKAPVLKVSGGLMAVPAPAGESIIRLEYHTAGLGASLTVAVCSLAAWLAYMALQIHSKRKKQQKA